MIKIKRGLDLPIAGQPEQKIHAGPALRSVALVGFDYVGMKPTMLVAEGDLVRTGQPLFTDKKTEGVQYTAPASGIVSAINRGAKRVFESLVIELQEDNPLTFASYEPGELDGLSTELVKENLINSGLWTALRTRPLSKVPAPDTEPHSIFVTATDTNPLAGDPAIVIAEHEQDFANGVTLLTRLTEGKVFVAVAADSKAPSLQHARVHVESFAGPHPAGLVGTHIHHLDPVNFQNVVWTIGYQDVIALGKLFTTGQLFTERVVSLAGPMVEKPRLLRTRLGANIDELCAGQLKTGEFRAISGSVLSGRKAAGAVIYLGRYASQVSVIAEGREREFMGWLSPGANKHSVLPIYLSRWFGGGKKLNMTSTTNGSVRAMVPVGSYEKVMPLDILPSPLLRALIVGDLETAQNLGALELDEEDLALCTYVSIGKYEYGTILRDNLTRIENEG